MSTNDYEAKKEFYAKVVATIPEVQLKGAKLPYTSLNGNMFSYLAQNGFMALRLPTDEREEFIKKFKTSLFEAYGIIQKEYVKVPESLLEDTKTLSKYFKISFEYAKTLKPKATKKK